MRLRLLSSLAVAAAGLLSPQILRAETDYLRDIKPVLKARCYACHGALKQEANLRLDTVAAMRQRQRQRRCRRSRRPDPARARDRGRRRGACRPKVRRCSKDEIIAIKNWLAGGRTLPATNSPNSIRGSTGPINCPRRRRRHRFAARGSLEHANSLQAASEAAPEIWLRRVYFDLIGLPPTTAELSAFLSSVSPPHPLSHSSPNNRVEAYEAVVDRLLDFPRLRRALGPALDGHLALLRLVGPRRGAPQQPEAHLALARLDRRVAQRRQGLRPDDPRDARGRRSSTPTTATRCAPPASWPGSTSSSTATPGWTSRSSTRPRRSSA